MRRNNDVIFYANGHTESWFLASDYKINGINYRKASTDDLLDELIRVKGTVKEKLIIEELDVRYEE